MHCQPTPSLPRYMNISVLHRQQTLSTHQSDTRAITGCQRRGEKGVIMPRMLRLGRPYQKQPIVRPGAATLEEERAKTDRVELIRVWHPFLPFLERRTS